MSANSEIDGSLKDRLAQLAAPLRGQPCACGATDWDEGVIIAAPISSGLIGPVLLEPTVTANALLWLGVLSCGTCRRAQLIRLMRSDAPTAPS